MSQTDTRPPVLGDLASGGEPTRRPPRLSGPARLRLALLAYGVLFAIVGGLSLADSFHGTGSVPMMGGRVSTVKNELVAQRQGAPPFTIVTPGVRFPNAKVNELEQAGYGDDPGLYIALPIVHRFTGSMDPEQLMRTLYVAAFVLLFLSWPLLLFEAFGSLLVALLAPLAVLHGFDYLQMTDVYWISGWALLLGVPVLLAAHRHWNRWTYGALVAATLAASFASAMRAQAGLPIVIAALALVLVHVPTWRRRGLAAAVLVVAYVLVTPIGIKGVIAYRDHELGNRAIPSRAGSHIVWHPVFLGLGWDRNPWGIYWYDGYAANLARSKDPLALLPSARYDQVIRHEYFADVTDDPWLVTKMYARKALVAIDIARHQALLGLALAALALAFLFDPFRRRQRAFVLLLAPALLLGLATQVLVEPITAYGMGFTVAVGLLALLPLAFLLAFIEERARTWNGGHDWRALLQRRPPRSTLDLAGLVALAVVAFFVARDLVGPAASRAQISSTQWQYHNKRTTRCDATETAPPSIASLRGTKVRTFDFSGGVPKGWQVVKPARVTPRPDGIAVHPSTLSGAYALIGPALKLPAGRYAVRLNGRLLVGGLTLGVLSSTTQSWIDQSPYFGPCPVVKGTTMGLPHFRTTGEPVRLILANFDPTSEGSSWVVRSLAITRQGG